MAMTAEAATTEMACRKKTMNVVHSPQHHNRPSVKSTSPPAEHRQHRTRQRQCTRDCQRTHSTRHHSRQMGVGGQSNNNGRILTPKMLNASNSRSLHDLLGNETNSNTASSSRTACHRTTLNTGTRLFRSDHSTTYFTTGTGRILPTNTWTMHQAPAALVDESLGHQPKTTSSTSRQRQRRLTFPTNDTPPDLPFVPTLNRSENVVSGHHYQGGRRRHTVTSIANVKPPTDLCSTSCCAPNKPLKRDDSIAINIKQIEEVPLPSLSTTAKGKAPDPPSTPYHELKMSSSVVANHVPIRSSPTSSFRRSVSLPSKATFSQQQEDCKFRRCDSVPTAATCSQPQGDHKSNHQDLLVTLNSSSRSTFKSNTPPRRPSLPIISEARHNLSCLTLLNTSPKMMNRSPFLHSKMMQDQSDVFHYDNHSSSALKIEHYHQYQVGEKLRDESHSIAFTSSAQAKILLSKLPVNSPLFVKRTSREWTYAIVVRWIDEQEQHPDVSDTEGRVVKEEELRSSLVVSLHSTRNSRKVLHRNQWEKCLRLVNSKAVVKDDVSTITADAASLTSVAEGYMSLETSSPKTSSKTIMMTSSAPSPNTVSSARSSMSDHFSTAKTVTSILSSADTIVGNPFVVRSVDDGEKNTIKSQTMTASLNKLHSKKVSWRDLDDVSSKSDATPVMSGAIASSSPGSDTDNTNSQTSSESPDTVNLYARHFWGSRRDRMRPRGIHRNKPRSMGCVSLCGDKDRVQQRMWCDSTCAPESGSFSDASGGSVWNTLLDNNSRKEHDAVTIPTLPYYFPTCASYSSTQ